MTGSGSAAATFPATSRQQMATSSQPFVSTMILNAFTLMMFLPLTASQCMDYDGMKYCSPDVSYSGVIKDLLECVNDCLVTPGRVCRMIQWEPQTKRCHLSAAILTNQPKGNCASFSKKPCNTIPDDGSLQEDSGNIFKRGQHMTFVASREECKIVCAIGSTCRAFTWLNERRQCMIHHQSKDRSRNKLRQEDYQVIKKTLRPKGRCVVLHAGGNSQQGIKAANAPSLGRCVEAVLNTSGINRVDWNLGNRECWSHSTDVPTYFHPVEDLMQLRKHEGCRLWREAVALTEHENTKMSGGLKLKGLSWQDCVELCQLVSNCAAVGWSDTLSECTFHLLKMSTVEDPSHTLYTVGGASIITSTTTAPTSTTVSTPTEATTSAPVGGTGTFLGAFFIRHDNNLLTSKSQRRAALECALLCFRSNCRDFRSGILDDDSVCGMNGSGTTGRSPENHFAWTKL